MSEKIFNTRIQQKHDIEVNWSKAVNFIPKIGEVIVYDPDENHAAARVKIGDGVKTVIELAFIDDAAKAALFKEIDMVDEKVEALGQLVGDASIPEQIEEALLKTQADWEVNDETSAAYVKNRTHWAESQLTEVFPETTITTTVNTYIPMDNPIQMSQDLVSDKEYIVEFDGTRYECVAGSDYGQAGAYWVYIGNGKLIDPIYIVQRQDCPFVVGLFANGETYFTAETAGDHTIAVYCYDEETVHQLDEKFIPDTIARIDDLPIAITPDRIDEICGIEPVMTLVVDEDGDAVINAGFPDDEGNLTI